MSRPDKRKVPSSVSSTTTKILSSFRSLNSFVHFKLLLSLPLKNINSNKGCRDLMRNDEFNCTLLEVFVATSS